MKIDITINETEVIYSIQANDKELKVFNDNRYHLEYLVNRLNKDLYQPSAVPTAIDPLAPIHAAIIANENL